MVHTLLNIFGSLYFLSFLVLIIEIARDGGIYFALGYEPQKKDNYEPRNNFILSIVFFSVALLSWSLTTKSPDKILVYMVVSAVAVYIITRSYFPKEKETV